jgi:hypothetical protein
MKFVKGRPARSKNAPNAQNLVHRPAKAAHAGVFDNPRDVLSTADIAELAFARKRLPARSATRAERLSASAPRLESHCRSDGGPYGIGRVALMASKAVLSIMAASPPEGRGRRRPRRQNRRRRYRSMATFLTWPGIDLLYERATVFERSFSPDCIRHDCDSTQRRSWALARARQQSFFGRLPCMIVTHIAICASNAPTALARAATASAGSSRNTARCSAFAF